MIKIKYIIILCFCSSLIFAQNINIIKKYNSFNIIQDDNDFQIQINDSIKFDVFNVKNISFAFCELISYYNSSNTTLPKYLRILYYTNSVVSNSSIQRHENLPLNSHSPSVFQLAVYETSKNKLYILNKKGKFVKKRFLKCK